MKKKWSAGLISTMLISGSAMADTSLEDKLAVLQEEIEHLKLQMAQSEQNRAGGIQGFADRTTVGGYGELHYNNYGGDVPAGQTLNKDEIDFHRFVLYFGHRFNDWISFKSEVEIEHSNTENSGAVELEQAYLDFNFSEKLNAKAGVFLLPLGFLNETHEPPTFYGVERNYIENRIIPTTWWEAGVGLYGEIAPGWKYQVGLTSSLNSENYKPSFTNAVRDGRQNVSEAIAENIAVTARLDYTGMPGLLVGASVFSGDTGQDNEALHGANARLTLWDLHAEYRKDRLWLRALYAQGHLGDAEQIKTAFNINAAEKFYGWYTEAAYHIWKDGDYDLAPFVRYEKWNTQDQIPANVVRNEASKNSAWTIGANFWPHPQVVLKADYQILDRPDGDNGDRRADLGVGYMF